MRVCHKSVTRPLFFVTLRFAIRAFHYRHITATITAKSLSIVLESLRHSFF